MVMSFTKRIHVFKSGDQTSAQGVQRHFSEKDLQQVVDTYDPSIHMAPLVIGHAGDNDSTPAYGWIKGFNRDGKNLYADVEFTPVAKDLVRNGHYRKVSISFYSPDSAINPSKGKWSARHLALLGASPPAVKGLEPFSFSEEEGVFDFAVTLSPSDIFDEELGPTLMVDKSPLEMLMEKLEAVREDISSAVKEQQGNQQGQPNEQVMEADASSVAGQPETAQEANPDANFNETENVGRKATEISQQTADLETQFPEEEFMDKGKISRKHAKGAHGQVMQVVENVYEEAHKESTAERKAAADRAFEAKRLKKEGEEGEAKEVKRFGKEEDKLIKEAKHSEDDMTDSGVQKRHGGDGGPGSADHAEFDYEEEAFGRDKTARSDSDSYAKRMEVGKEGADGETGRYKTAKDDEQDEDRLNTAKSSEMEEDRLKTAKHAPENGRWAGQEDGYDQVHNNDQYDLGAGDYPEPNRPQTASGSNPAGRVDADTKVPTETEEGPDDTVFASKVENVMSDGDMRVLRTKSSDGRRGAKGGPIQHNFNEEDEELSAEHGEHGGKKKQLEPGGMDDPNEPAETVGPGGAYAERGEKKSNDKLLSGVNGDVDDPAEHVGPGGAYAEGKQKVKGHVDNLDTPAETTKKSGGVYAEEHGEKRKDQYTKTGYGSQFMEDEEGGQVQTRVDHSEDTVDHSCGMDYMGSAGMARPMGAEHMYEELMNLKQKYAELERRHAEEKRMYRMSQMANFVEALYEEGRLTDGIMPQEELLSYCEGLEFGTLEFAEGETSATKLLALLSKLPPMVSFGEVAGGSFQYAEEADLDPHAQALRLVEQSEGKMDYVEALKRTMFN